jgi:hypothetical protein
MSRVSRRLQAPAILLGLLAVFSAIAWLRYRPSQPNYPAGSSLSTQPDGTRALLLWMQATGLHASSSQPASGIPAAPPDELLIVDPLLPLPGDSARLDAVADRGGTIVLAAGRGPAGSSFFSALGVSADSGSLQAKGVEPGSEDSVPMNARLTLRAPNATPLLTAADGSWLALRMPFRQGTVIALASSLPLTNQGLRDADTARFVYQQVLATAPSQASMVFDETYHQLPQVGVGGFDLEGVLVFALRTPAGAAILYGCLIVLFYVALAGRRLGPPLPAAQPEANRTLYEQVQAVAGLYRRARRSAAVREHFSRRARRMAASALGSVDDAPPEVTAGLASIDAAASEGALATAVRQTDAALANLPRSWRRPA